MNARLSIALLVVTGAGLFSCATPEAHADHRFCGWLDGPGDDPAFTEQAYATFAAHADDFDVVHPTWWHVASPTSFAGRAGRQDPRVLSHTTPGGARTKLVPTVAAVHRPDYLYVHRMINDPELRHQHVRALVDLAVDNGYDGLDLDYEHLDLENLKCDMGPGHTGTTERAAFSEFFAEAARAMHAAGKTISVTVPVIADLHDPTYDYDRLSEEADAVHVMNYDYHYEGGPHVGPLAPLGWVEENLEIIRGIDGGARAGKFLLGLPNYGVIGPEATPDGHGTVRVCQPSSRCGELFQGAYDVTTTHMSHCNLALGHRKDSGRTPNVELGGGERLFFEDLASLDERITAGKRSGLGGVAYWSIGGEPGGEAFFAMIRERYPRPLP